MNAAAGPVGSRGNLDRARRDAHVPVALRSWLLFEPLGMARMTSDPTVAMTYPLAQSHVLDEGGQGTNALVNALPRIAAELRKLRS